MVKYLLCITPLSTNGLLWYGRGMKIKNYKKNKQEQIFEILDKQGYILDNQTLKIFGDENGLYNVHEHIRIWKKLKSDEAFFKDKKIVEKKKGHRSHLIRLEGEEGYYKVGKEYFNSIEIENK